MSKYKIYFIGNAGIMLSSEHYTIMIDGLYVPIGERGYSSPIPLDVFLDIFDPKGKLPKPDYLLFTHCHGDHFSADLVSYYLTKYCPNGIYVPSETNEFSKKSKILADSRNIDYIMVKKNVEIYYVDRHLQFYFYRTEHLGKNFHKVLHYCIVIRLGEKKFLFTSDFNFFTESLDFIYKDELTGIFVNPLTYHNKLCGQIINNIKQVHNIFIYHVPFIIDDCFHLQKMIRKDMKRSLFTQNTELLNRPYQNYLLDE